MVEKRLRTRLSSLPSLDALRGFVAAARRKSITLAADDLCLTQSAVSRQILSLEKQLSQTLFIRKHRILVLTEAGEHLFQFASPWMEQLSDLTENMRRGRSLPVTFSASHGVCSLWLLPRLGRFSVRHPGIDVRIAADNRLVDLDREGIDLAMRYCAKANAPKPAMPLFSEVIVPVAEPKMAQTAFNGRNALLHHVLLELDYRGHPWLRWNDWMSMRGFGRRRTKGFMHFNHYDQVIHAALAGHGTALGRLALLQGMLSEGRLIALMNEKLLVDDYGYWLIEATEKPREEVVIFREWLLQEASDTKESIDS